MTSTFIAVFQFHFPVSFVTTGIFCLSPPYSLSVYTCTKVLCQSLPLPPPPPSPQVRYLQDFAERLELNIQYNTEITEVGRPPQTGSEPEPFHLKDQNGAIYYCKVLIVR